uniref:Uncharacterized protein n=1 Tax=Rhizophagus irregularis (strain DAOM 181602 / DAOM 197198 / MUCL 43194) TaxID=747089 RepID=U9SHA6_RHIID
MSSVEATKDADKGTWRKKFVTRLEKIVNDEQRNERYFILIFIFFFQSVMTVLHSQRRVSFPPEVMVVSSHRMSPDCLSFSEYDCSARLLTIYHIFQELIMCR